jgi:radical SAM protein with 4Fe4S-binding SPASM domain
VHTATGRTISVAGGAVCRNSTLMMAGCQVPFENICEGHAIHPAYGGTLAFDNAIDEVRNEPRWKAARDASINLCEKCRQCKFMNACGGGYLPHRFSKKNGYDNPSVYCDDLYSMFENMQSVLERHLYVSKPGGERLDVRDALGRA